MNVMRVTIETDKGFKHEIGQFKTLEEAIRALDAEREKGEIKMDKPQEDEDYDPYKAWSIKMRWVDDEIPY